MTLALPAVLTPAVLPWTCSACLRPDSDGTHAPGAWDGEEGAYRYVEGPWLCRRCSRLQWAAHLAAVRERLALIRLSWRLGYPARRSDLARDRASLGGVQLTLWDGASPTQAPLNAPPCPGASDGAAAGPPSSGGERA